MATWNELDLGGVDAYAAAVKAGYTGTRQQWMTAMQNAEANGLKSEGFATGKQNGVAVESGTYFHDNAQYYKEQAEAANTAAQAAKDAAETAAERDTTAWMNEHITNPDSPPLDRTLASSSGAAPADMVGDLKSAFKVCKDFTALTGDVAYVFQWERGSITSGQDSADTKRARTVGYYSTDIDYIQVKANWYVWVIYYDSSYNWHNGSSAWTTGKIVIDKTYPYVRLALKNVDSNYVFNNPPTEGNNVAGLKTTPASDLIKWKNYIVRTNETQSFTDAQKKTGRDNIGAASEFDLSIATNVEKKVYKKENSPVLSIGAFENGDISGNGVDTSVKKRIVNNNIIDVSTGLYAYANDSGFAFAVVFYDSEDTVTKNTGWVDAYNIPKDSKIRFVVKRVTESSAEIADVLEFGTAISYNADLNNLLHDADCFIGIKKSGSFSFESCLESGTISSGSEESDNTRCRSGFVDLKGYGITSIKAESGYSMYPFKYKNGSYTALASSWVSEVYINPEEGYTYRFIARKNDNARAYPLAMSKVFTITVRGNETEDFIKTLAYSKSNEAMTDAVTENSPFICIPWISDNHINPADASSLLVTKDTLDCLDIISKKLPVDFIAHTGDIADKPYIDGGGTASGVCQSANEYLDKINKYKNLLVTNGNHDGLDANHYYAWRFYYYMNGKICEDITERPTDCAYFYKDMPINKLRLIFLSCPDDPDYYGWNTNQLYWLVNNALDTPEDYKVLFFCHFPTVWTSTVGGSALNNKTALETIITAYANGTSGSVTLLDETTLSYSFSEAKTVVAWMCGHTHRDTVVDVGETVNGGQTNGLPCKQIVIGASKFEVATGGGTVGGTSPSRTMGTSSEILFDVIMYYPLKKKINLIRCGAGSSRSISIDYN